MMKNQIKSAVLLSLIVSPLAAFAQTGTSGEAVRIPAVGADWATEYEQWYINNHPRQDGLPYPVRVKSPQMNTNNFAGTKLGLKFQIDEHGVPQKIAIVSGSPDLGLAQVTRNAMKDWRFAPAMQNGTAVPVDATIELTFVSPDPVTGGFSRDTGTVMVPVSMTVKGQTYALR